MIQQEQRIIAFNRLGKFLREINPENPTYDSLFEVVYKAKDNKIRQNYI